MSKKKPITQKTAVWLAKDAIVSQVVWRWYSYMWDRLSDCWKLNISLETMYKLQRLNTEAQSAKDLIVKMVGKIGLRFTKWDKVVDNKAWAKRIKELFTDPQTNSYKTFRDKYYTNSFCSGSVSCFIATMGDGSKRVQILDSRGVSKDADGFWNMKRFYYNQKEYPLSKIHSQITKYDPDDANFWMSIYETVVYVAFSDFEASKRNYYFFKNNAMPNVILTMEDWIENPEEVNAAIKRFEDRYKWSENAHGVMATGGIKEVKTIDFTNRDLELLELNKFSIKKMGIVFWFDPRFLSYKDDKNGSHAEYEKMANQSDKSMVDYADVLEEFMYQVTKKIYPEFPFDSIQLINDQFLDPTVKQDLILKKLEKWAITFMQAIEELWYPTDGLPEYLDTHFINIQNDSIENILNKSTESIKQIKVATKKMWEEEKVVEKPDNSDKE